jgi:hypothetical protein
MCTEVKELQQKYKSIQINITHPNQFNIILYDPFEDVLPKTLEFSIPKDYPFVPPQIFTHLNIYNGQQTKDKIPYIKTIHCCEIPSVIKKLKKYYDKNLFISECLNCSFITNYWSPALGTPNIITAIEKIQLIKRQIKYEIIIERFYKTDKLPIEMLDIIGSFLFTPLHK